jgi:hypothetical protein
MRHLFDELAADWDAEEDAIAKIELEHPPTLELLEISEVCQISLHALNWPLCSVGPHLCDRKVVYDAAH